MDINLLLLACWLALGGTRPLADADLVAIETGVAAWRAEVVEPLRQARRALRSRGEIGAATRADVRRAILKAELHAEKIAQRQMIEAVVEQGLLKPGPAATARATAEASLEAYRRSKGIALDADFARAMDRLLDLALSADA